MGVLIAGTSSSSGKTTVSIGLMAALCAKGVKVAPFKVGPDYIDPGFHEHVTSIKSHNLDAFMVGEENLRYLYAKYAQGRCAVIEGVMGMYDGYGQDCTASSAHVAKIIDVPVILVIDGKGVSTSAAAEVKGFAEFDKEVKIAGVIVNRVSGAAHYEMIKTAVEKYTGIPCLGYLPKNNEITLSSRHLGLIPYEEVADLNARIERLRDLVEVHIDIDRIAKIAKDHKAKHISMPDSLSVFFKDNRKRFAGKRIGIAKDIAFSFYYEANLDMLRELGAELVAVSPLMDKKLPKALDALYIGGGFPEVFAQELSDNKQFIDDLSARLEGGLKCYAECGGFMYLSRCITMLDDKTYDMTGFYDMDCRMTKRLQRFGYVAVNYDGLKFGAHEFHHSYMEGGMPDYRYRMDKHRDGRLIKTWQCGAKKKNTLAAYPHVHFYAEPQFAGKVFIDG